MKTITSFQIIDHGVQNSQYFQGCGIAHTTFTGVATGIGSTRREALEDALESLAQNDWETNSIKNELSDCPTVPDDAEDCYHYISVRVK